jgi:hypothetical protein
VDCAALRSILPPNFCGGGGSWLPSIVVVALGEPGVPVVCWAPVIVAVGEPGVPVASCACAVIAIGGNSKEVRTSAKAVIAPA